MNYATVWEQVAAALPESAAAWQDGRATSYRELDDGAGRIAAALRAAGIGAGDRVGIALYNSPEYLEVLFAALKLGAIPFNVNYRYRERELEALLADAGAAALFYDPALAERVAPLPARLPGLRLLARAGPPAAVEDPAVPAGPPGEVELGALRAGNAPLAHAERSPDDVLFVYTGGTTGQPKGVIWAQGDLFAAQAHRVYREIAGAAVPVDAGQAVAVARTLAARGAAPRLMPVVPLMHATALFNAIGTLALGGTVVLAPGRSLDPAAVWRTVEGRRVTRLSIAGDAVAAPLARELARAARAGEPYAIDSLQAITSSGVAWTDGVKRELLAHGSMTLVEVLASTEGGPYAIARTASADDLPARFALTAHTRVLDGAGEDVEPGSGRTGMLAYHGPMPRGYHGDRERSAALLRDVDGVRHVMSGDLVSVAADGSIDFLGRGSGVVNSGGEKVFPAEVEGALLSHPDVADCAVVGVPDERWGEAVAALVALVPSARASADELIAHVGERLAGYKKPRRVAIVDRVPRGPNAKLDLGEVRALAARAPAR